MGRDKGEDLRWETYQKNEMRSLKRRRKEWGKRQRGRKEDVLEEGRIREAGRGRRRNGKEDEGIGDSREEDKGRSTLEATNAKSNYNTLMYYQVQQCTTGILH